MKTFDSSSHPLVPERQASPAPPLGLTTLADNVGLVLEEISTLEAELDFLEGALPPLKAKIDAAVRPLIDEIIRLRQELVGIVERLLNVAPRRSSLHRDGMDLILHLATDLEERFGVDVRQILNRWNPSSPETEDDEDLEAEDFSWARAETHVPPRPESRQNPKRIPLNPETAGKAIYRSLARELHPDKTRDESERLRRTHLMQNLTKAWRERDLGALLKLLHAHGSDEAKEDALDPASLKICFKGLCETRDQLRRKVRHLRHQGLPGGVVDWLPIVRDPKLFERLLRRQKSLAREELEPLRHWKAQWQSPGGLERFFREVPEEMWDQVV